MDRDALFRDNIAWAEEIARKFHRRLPPWFDLENLQQEARIELWKRAQAYDSARNSSFRGYAYVAVLGAVKMACRRRHWAEANAPEPSPDTRDSSPRPDEQIEANQDHGERLALARARIERFAELAPQAAAEVFLLRQVCTAGATIEEIAAAWRLDPAVIAGRLSRAARMLRKALDEG